MTSQQQQHQQRAQGERPSRAKSKPKKEASVPDSASAQSGPAMPPFDYLVPMNICVRSAASQQQPQVDEQPLVECVSWALLNRLTGQTEASSSLRLDASRRDGSRAEGEKSVSLSEAILQVDKSLEGKKCVLVTCGPVPLRQHLHPIAKRLGVELTDNFGQYVDLLKEFDRCTFANNLSGRQVARANASAGPAACCRRWPACECSSPPGCFNKEAGFAEKEGLQRVISSGQPGDECVLATPAPAPLQQQQVQQPISQGSRKRFEEILKFLSIGLDTADCKSACALTPAARQCNCAPCSQALLKATCSIVERLLREGHQFNRLERIKRRVEVGLCETSAHEAEQRVVRARGLPWQASEQDIADFFTGLNIAKGGVGLCLSRQGRRNGEALIQFESREHRNLALSRHKHFMGNRYIEVYRASGDDFQSVAAGYNNKAEAFISKGAQFIVRMRGLPFTCTAKQVVDFFASSDAKSKSCEVFAGEEGVLFVRNQDEKPTGDAFVLFATDEHTRRAIAKHHQNIGTRYVELFRSTVSEVQQVLSVSVGPDEQTAPSSGVGKQPVASVAKSKPQASSEQSKTTASKSPLASKSANYASALDNRSAFPALSEKAVAWQRPDAATYAQVTHSRPAPPAEKCASKVQQATAMDAPACPEEDSTAAGDQKTEHKGALKGVAEKLVDGEQQNSSVQDTEGADASPESVAPSRAERDLLVTACESLSLASNDEGPSEPPSAPHSPASCSASSSAPAPTPGLVRSPVSGSCSSSQDSSSTSSSSNMSHKQAPSQQLPGGHHGGARRYHSQNYSHGRSSTRYQHQNYVYHSAAAMVQQQAVMYNQELMQTTMQQQSAQLPYSTPHHQMAYAAGQPHPAPFDSSPQQLAGQQQAPPPPYSANSMDHHQRAQQVYASAAAASADPALMSRRDCIRLRGLPFEAQIDDVLHFLGKHSESILYQGVHMVYSAQGQPTGEAIIQMNSSQAASAAAQEAHRRVMSVGKKQRYIEVIPSSIDDLKPTLGYGLAAFAASRAAAAAAAAAYAMHPMHYAAFAAGAQMGPMDPIAAGYHHAALHSQHLPYVEAAPADCYSMASGQQQQQQQQPVASASNASSEMGVSPTPEQSALAALKSAGHSEPAGAEDSGSEAQSSTPKSADGPEEERERILEAKETPSEPVGGPQASLSSASSAQPITTTATSSSQPMQQHQHQLQQQQALMAAAQAAAYYHPILYYYPPPQQHILASAPPSANRYH